MKNTSAPDTGVLQQLLRDCENLSLCVKLGDVLQWKNGHLQQLGARLLLIADGRIAAMLPEADIPEDLPQVVHAIRPNAAMADFSSCTAAPGILEGHAHLFLSPHGDVTSVVDELHDRARVNAVMALRHGTFWLRDCGDPHGINLSIRNQSRTSTEPMPFIRACGAAIHRRKRYGKQLGIAVDTDQDLLSAARERIANGADDVKLVLSGIVNFEKAEVPGEAQFPVSAVRDVVTLAHDNGRRVIAHASGEAGCLVAADAGVDTIEHAYFVSPQTLDIMAAKRLTWLPTLAPVHAQWRDAERYGHSPAIRDSLRRILDGHAQRIAYAAEIGVCIAGGSDSGSPGVGHGSGAVDEFALLAEAGLGRMRAYAACSAPGAASLGFTQSLNACEGGAAADFLILSTSPLDDPSCLNTPRAIVRHGRLSAYIHEPARCGS